MKRTLLILLCVVCVLGYASGQETISGSSIFADRSVNGEHKKETESTPRVGKYAKEYKMSEGESLQEAVAKSALGTPSIGTDDLDASFSTNLYWGTVYAANPDIDETLFYTKELTVVNTYYYSKVAFTFYDGSFTKLHEISFDLPNKCNDARVLEDYSSKIWNTDTNLEFVFMVHYFNEPGGPTNQVYDHYVYTTKNGATLLTTLPNVLGIAQYFNKSIANNSFFVVDKWLGNTAEKIEMEVYKSRNYNPDTSTASASYEIDTYATVGFDGPIFDTRTIDGVDYYCLAHYELPYYKEQYPNWTIEVENNFMLQFYKASDWTLAKEITIPIVQESETNPIEASFGMAFREFDVSTTVFNDDDKWELIYAKNHYVTSADDYFPIYCLINEDGEVLKQLPFMIGDAIKLTDIAGHETQYAITHNSGGGITAISFLDLPSWEIVGTLNARHNGELLSMNFNRYPVDNSYVHIFAMGEVYQEDGLVFNKINWYNPDGSLYKDHRIYMEGNDYFFEAMIGASTLNPYLFNTDDKMEYIGFCGTRIEGNETLVSARIYNEDSELLFSAADNGSNKVGAGLYTASNGKHWEYFIIVYSNTTPSGTTRTCDFYPLPLSSFAGGDGTPADPYVIVNAADFDQIRSNPTASYIMADDIDLTDLLAIEYKSGWESIPTFGGTLDAKGHTIRGFKTESTDIRFGLFSEISIGNAQECWIKNLKIEDAELYINSANTYVGILGANVKGNASTENRIYIDNVNVTGKILNKATSATSGVRGGIVGDASYNTTIQNSSFVGTIESEFGYGTANIGGIVGKANNNISINSSYTKGKIAMANGTSGSVGGIVGNLGARCTVKDSYSTMDVSATSFVGGIVGNFNTTTASVEKGLVENCYATGVIVANNTNQTAKTYAGGIIGSSDYNKNHVVGYGEDRTIDKTKINQQGLVALNTKVTATNGHRVAGESNDSSWVYEGFGVFTADSVKNVYAIADMLIGAAGSEVTVTSTDNESVDGASIAADGLTKTFYTGIGWKFGENMDSPWVWNENGNPRLYTEFKVNSISLNTKSALIDLRETLQLTATVAPEEAWNSNVSWSSSANEIATVDENGLVTGVHFGTVIITATTEDGSYTATCEVKVGKAEAILLNKSTLNLVAGKDETLTVSTSPKDSAISELEWESSNKSVAIVDSNGRVTAVAIGNCTITVTMKGTEMSASCEVNVKAAESVSLNKNILSLAAGANETLIATIDPADGLYTDLTWESSDNSVATVNAFGKVTAVADGTCTIKVKLDKSDLFDTCEVTVGANAIDDIRDAAIQVISFKDYIQVTSAQLIENVKVYNMNGQLVYSSEGNSANLEIPVSGWNKGVYVVKVLSGNKMEHIKVFLK